MKFIKYLLTLYLKIIISHLIGNFAVGQNIATSLVWNTPTIPEIDWPSPIRDWFNEIKFFHENAIDPFLLPPPPPEETYLHFTQVLLTHVFVLFCSYEIN